MRRCFGSSGCRSSEASRPCSCWPAATRAPEAFKAESAVRVPASQYRPPALPRDIFPLSRAGAEPIGRVGEHFDPARHEAVALRPGNGKPDDTVLAVPQVGYRLDDGTLVRPARVVVAGEG